MNQLLQLSKQPQGWPGMLNLNGLQCKYIWGVGMHKKGEAWGEGKSVPESLQKHILQAKIMAATQSYILLPIIGSCEQLMDECIPVPLF